MANELAKEQFIIAESKMGEKYCRLLAEHEKDSLKSLICMYLVQTRLSLVTARLGTLSFIMSGCFETQATLPRMVKLQRISQYK